MKITGTATQIVEVDISPKEALKAIADAMNVPRPKSLQEPNPEFIWELEYCNNRPNILRKYQADETNPIAILTRKTHGRLIDRFAAVEQLADYLD